MDSMEEDIKSTIWVGPAPEEEQEEADHYLPPQNKSKKTDTSFTDVQEAQLVEWFRENPIFYDQSLRDFKNKPKKNRMLAEKGLEFGVSGSDVSLWYRSQRTIYGRLRKQINGLASPDVNLTSRQRWVMNAFSFLASHVMERSERSETKQLRKIAKRGNPVSEAQRRLELQCVNDREVVTGTNNSRVAWAQWMSAELVGLPDGLWRRFQKESFELVMRYQEVACCDRSSSGTTTL